jgi:hypothetical protein
MDDENRVMDDPLARQHQAETLVLNKHCNPFASPPNPLCFGVVVTEV